MSYEALDAHAQAMLETALDHPGREFTLAPIACGMSIQVGTARATFDGLISKGLVKRIGNDRYQVQDAPGEHDQALHDAVRLARAVRTVRWYQRGAAAVALAVDPGPRRIGTSQQCPAVTPFPSSTAAMRWFDVEHPNMMAAHQQLVDYRLRHQVCAMAEDLWGPLRLARADGDVIASQQLGIEAAQALNDRPRESLFRSRAGTCLSERAEHAAAVTECTRAHWLAHETGQRWLEVIALDARARAHLRAGAVEAARRDARYALDFASQLGDKALIAQAHILAGECRLTLGESHRA